MEYEEKATERVWDAAEAKAEAGEQADVGENPELRTGARRWFILAAALILALIVAAYVWGRQHHEEIMTHYLGVLGQKYLAFVEEKGRGPMNRGEFSVFGFGRSNEYSQNPEMRAFKRALLLLESDQIELVWCADMEPGIEANGNYILGFEANALHHGGMVLMGDGSVKHLSAEEFMTTPKVPTRERS